MEELSQALEAVTFVSPYENPRELTEEQKSKKKLFS